MPFIYNPISHELDLFKPSGGPGGFVTGPAVSSPGDIAVFSGTMGNVIADSGITISMLLQAANNLSDLNNVSTARTNLGLTNVSISSTTLNAVQIGNSSNGLSSVGPGLTNQVLNGNTGLAPSWGSVPAAALPGSGSITLNNGNNITLSNNTIALGGSSTINLTNTITLPNTTSGGASVVLGTVQFMSNLGTQNAFLGGAGNLTLTTSSATLNTGIGFHALISITTASENTAMGNQCIQNNSTGVQNTGVGSQCLKKTTGQQNTSIGAEAGENIITGSNNTLAGYNAGNNYTSSESSNIIIGSGILGVLGESNVCRIGNIYGSSVGSTNAIALVDNTNLLGSLATGLTGAKMIVSDVPAPAWDKVTSTVDIISFEDDFICGTGNAISIFSWFQETGGGASINVGSVTTASATHPGVVEIHTGTGNFANAGIALYPNLTFGGGVWQLTFIAKLSALSNGSTNRYRAILGFGDEQAADSNNNGLWFSYQDNQNSGDWIINSGNNGTKTATNTTVAATTNWTNFKIIVNAAGTLATFFINGTSAGTITTNIPTSNLTGVVISMVNEGVSGTDQFLSLDYVLLYNNLTTPRL